MKQGLSRRAENGDKKRKKAKVTIEYEEEREVEARRTEKHVS